MDVHIGSWGLPLAGSLVVVVWFLVWANCRPDSYGYGKAGDAGVVLIAFFLMLAVVLTMWFAWALTNLYLSL